MDGEEARGAGSGDDRSTWAELAVDIDRRKALVDLTEADAERLLAVRPLVLGQLEGVVRDFLDGLRRNPEMRSLLGGPGLERRLRASLLQHLRDLFSGRYDEPYVGCRRRIGSTHLELGVEPRHFLSGVALLEELCAAMLDAVVADTAAAAEVRRSLDKLMAFDTALIIDTYVQELRSDLEQRHRIDPLTGLLHRGAFCEMLELELSRAARIDQGLSLLYFDLDGFKRINDTQGHLRGDQVLRRVGLELMRIKRGTDLAGRFGGDEFWVLLPHTEEGGAQIFARRVAETIRASTGVGISYGLVHAVASEGVEADQLLELADRRMYEMKRRWHDKEDPSRCPE